MIRSNNKTVNINYILLYSDATYDEIISLTNKITFANLIINKNPHSETDERTYFKDLERIFKILSTTDIQYNITIEYRPGNGITNRHPLNQSNLFSYPKINLIINTDNHRYTKKEYLHEEEKIEQLIKNIKQKDLSPYERFLAAYDIVKRYKQYKDSQCKTEARAIRYFLDNDYMVCVGFTKLLMILLDRLDIPNKELPVYIDKMEQAQSEHTRLLIKIDDDKYNIHGIYQSDPTWDNDFEEDLFEHSTMTFDDIKELPDLEYLTNEDLLLDCHSKEEFYEKISYYINKKRTYCSGKNDMDKLINTYNILYRVIMNIILHLDYNKYIYFYNKYSQYFKSKDVEINKLRTHLNDFLEEYVEYILPISNNKIPFFTTIVAETTIKRSVYNLTNQDIKKWLSEVKKSHSKNHSTCFPYHFDYTIKRKNYLTKKG